MNEENVCKGCEQPYAKYPEGFEKLLKDLKFPTEDEGARRMLLNATISSLLHY